MAKKGNGEYSGKILTACRMEPGRGGSFCDPSASRVSTVARPGGHATAGEMPGEMPALLSYFGHSVATRAGRAVRTVSTTFFASIGVVSDTVCCSLPA